MKTVILIDEISIKKATNKGKINWANGKITLNGKQIETTHINYDEFERKICLGMEYYFRKGNKHYFRNKKGTKIMIKSNDLYNNMKYGSIVKLDIY